MSKRRLRWSGRLRCRRFVYLTQWSAKAYEYLERRFDSKTRVLAGLLFLVSRGLAVGVIISAPAVVLSIVLGWNLVFTALAIGVPTTVYTMVGGVQAVTWADVKQMVVIVGGVGTAMVLLGISVVTRARYNVTLRRNQSMLAGVHF